MDKKRSIEMKNQQVIPMIWKCKAKLSCHEIWENIVSHHIVEAYHLNHQNANRNHPSLNLPHVVECLGKAEKNGRFMIIQRIPNRLSQVKILNQTQTLKVLYGTLKGFINLKQVFGFFEVNEDCICFNSQGQVKIWINPNLSQMKPIKPLKAETNTINWIIEQIIAILERKCFNPMIVDEIKKIVWRNKKISFEQTLSRITKLAEDLFVDLKENKEQRISHNYPKRDRIHTELQVYSEKDKQNNISSPNDSAKESQKLFSQQIQSAVQNTPLSKCSNQVSNYFHHHKRNKSSLDNFTMNQLANKNFSSSIYSQLGSNHVETLTTESKKEKMEQNAHKIQNLKVKFPEETKITHKKYSLYQNCGERPEQHKINYEKEKIVLKYPNVTRKFETKLGIESNYTQTVESEGESKNYINIVQTFGKIVSNSETAQTQKSEKQNNQNFSDLDLSAIDERIQNKLKEKASCLKKRPSLENILRRQKNKTFENFNTEPADHQISFKKNNQKQNICENQSHSQTGERTGIEKGQKVKKSSFYEKSNLNMNERMERSTVGENQPITKEGSLSYFNRNRVLLTKR